MRLILTVLIAAAAMWLTQTPSHAQTADPPVLCEGLRVEWTRVGPQATRESAAAFLARVPQVCARLRAQVTARATGSSSQTAPGASGGRAGAALPRDCAFCPELRYIPAGTFQMGSATSPTARPVHAVRITRAFAMTATEITAEAYSACINDSGCQTPANGLPPDLRLPVTLVSHNEARQFATWLSRTTGHQYRLPTETEWEYAARAGTRTAAGCASANIASCGAMSVMPVAQKTANAWGLRDMIGNVSEWTADCFNNGYNGAPSDQSAWATGSCTTRSVRGGSYFDGADMANESSRDSQAPDVRGPTIGFRLVRELDG